MPPQPQHLATSRRQPFVRANSMTHSAPMRASVDRENVKVFAEKMKTCADPSEYVKCVVSNYLVKASGSDRYDVSECEIYCTTPKK